jgi:hypothetical protein
MPKTRLSRPLFGRGLALAALLCAIGCMSAPGAWAAPIGSGNLEGSPDALLGCTNAADSCIQTQDDIDGDQSVNVVPPGGRILTRFRVRYASNDVALVILRQVGGNLTQPAGTVDVSGSGVNEVQSFTTHVAVQPGDFIGLKLGPNASLGVLNGGASTNAFELSDETSPAVIDGNEPYELLLDATVEADRDGDGRGDLSEDPDGGYPSTGGGGGGGGGGGEESPADPAPAVPDLLAGLRAGQKPKARILGRKLKASKRGVVRITVSNPNAFRIKGRLKLKSKGLALGSKSLSIAAGSRRTVRITLSGKAFRALKRRRRMGATATVTVRGPIGKSRTVKRKFSIKAPPKPKKKKRSTGGGGGGNTPGCRRVKIRDGYYKTDPATGVGIFQPPLYRECA